MQRLDQRWSVHRRRPSQPERDRKVVECRARDRQLQAGRVPAEQRRRALLLLRARLRNLARNSFVRAGRACPAAPTLSLVGGYGTIARPVSFATQPSDDLAILHRIVARDEAALADLYDRYGRLLYSMALRVLRRPT